MTVQVISNRQTFVMGTVKFTFHKRSLQ